MSNPSQEPAQNPVFLDLRNISKSFGAIEALNKLGFNIKEKQISEGLKKTSWKGRLEIINYLNVFSKNDSTA